MCVFAEITRTVILWHSFVNNMSLRPVIINTSVPDLCILFYFHGSSVSLILKATSHKDVIKYSPLVCLPLSFGLYSENLATTDHCDYLYLYQNFGFCIFKFSNFHEDCAARKYVLSDKWSI